jgi:phosphotransferase system HPr (HPr) family protein
MPATEARCQVEVLCPEGLHLRLAAQFARLASGFRADIRVHRRDDVADGKSVLSLITLAAERGTQLDLEVRGTDAEGAVAALTELLASYCTDAVDGRRARPLFDETDRAPSRGLSPR